MELKTAQRAAKWWGDLLATHDQLSPDLRERLEGVGLNESAKIITQFDKNTRESQEMAPVFEKALVYILSRKSGEIYIDVDYHPEEDGILLSAAEIAMIPYFGMNSLPNKTSMIIDDNTILVRCGHYGEWKLLEE